MSSVRDRLTLQSRTEYLVPSGSHSIPPDTVVDPVNIPGFCRQATRTTIKAKKIFKEFVQGPQEKAQPQPSTVGRMGDMNVVREGAKRYAAFRQRLSNLNNPHYARQNPNLRNVQTEYQNQERDRQQYVRKRRHSMDNNLNFDDEDHNDMENNRTSRRKSEERPRKRRSEEGRSPKRVREESRKSRSDLDSSHAGSRKKSKESSEKKKKRLETEKLEREKEELKRKIEEQRVKDQAKIQKLKEKNKKSNAEKDEELLRLRRENEKLKKKSATASGAKHKRRKIPISPDKLKRIAELKKLSQQREKSKKRDEKRERREKELLQQETDSEEESDDEDSTSSEDEQSQSEEEVVRDVPQRTDIEQERQQSESPVAELRLSPWVRSPARVEEEASEFVAAVSPASSSSNDVKPVINHVAAEVVRSRIPVILDDSQYDALYENFNNIHSSPATKARSSVARSESTLATPGPSRILINSAPSSRPDLIAKEEKEPQHDIITLDDSEEDKDMESEEDGDMEVEDDPETILLNSYASFNDYILDNTRRTSQISRVFRPEIFKVDGMLEDGSNYSTYRRKLIDRAMNME